MSNAPTSLSPLTESDQRPTLRPSAHMEPRTFLYDVPPEVVDRFCRIMDSGEDRFGWRALAARVFSSWLEVRMLERTEATGRSPTRELLWSWAQQNSRVQDLVKVLQDMGHLRALELFLGQTQGQLQANERPEPLPLRSQHAECTGRRSGAPEEESLQLEASPSRPALSPMRPTGENQPPSISFQDIIEGTRDFHPEMRISESRFSEVYRAQVGNKEVAVKLFKKINQASWKTLWDIFRKEMEVHHLHQHPNILELWGCFSDEVRYCLVYPYLPSGSLFYRLHTQDEQPLSWLERLAIIKGIAKALHHLHTAQPCPVICGNISSDNILLDDALQPKLSNFGSARLSPPSANQSGTIVVDKSSHSNLGYLPEEYIRDGKLSFSLDVYSFGMVIMETLTGRKVIEDVPKQTLLRDVLVSEVEDSGGVDSCLQFLDAKAGQMPTAMALSLLRLAFDCTAIRPRSRPSMENVLVVLSQLLPPPCCPPSEQPCSLDDRPLSMQHEEQHSLPGSLKQAGPCECSQSEVTYLSDTGGAQAADLYSSWPVECSCLAEAGGLLCEDCRASYMDSPH